MFAVIIPVYNKEKYLESAIRSVLDQSFTNYTIYLVDDGSTDQSVSIMDRYAGGRVRVIRQKNGGVSSARNTGIRAAKEDYACFLDADDRWKPDFLETISGLIEMYPSAGMYATAYETILGRDVRKPAIIKHGFRPGCAGLITNYFRVATVGDPPVTSSSVCVPKKILEASGGFSEKEKWGEDLDLWGRIALCHPVAFSDRICAEYHQEALGRACNAYDRRTDWVFFGPGMEALQGGLLPAEVREDLKDYLNYKRVDIGIKSMKSGNYRHAYSMFCRKDPNKIFRKKTFYFFMSRLHGKLMKDFRKALSLEPDGSGRNGAAGSGVQRDRSTVFSGIGRPFFSVILPVYNGEKYLEKTIESVLVQTFDGWELVIVDDASTDRTPEIIRRYAEREPRIRAIRNEKNINCGPSSNRAIGIARGYWITRLDADDIYKPDYLACVHQTVTGLAGTGESFVTTYVSIIDDEGRRIMDVRVPPGPVVRRKMGMENFIFHTATSFPRSLWQKAGGYPPNQTFMPDDLHLWKKFLRAGASVVVIPKSLVDYRIHSSNLTFLSESRFDATPDTLDQDKRIRKGSEWKASLFLKQGMLTEAKEELLRLKERAGRLSLKNRFYLHLSQSPRPYVHFVMWELRPLGRGLLRLMSLRKKV